jgi:precorrin-6B methylase 2
MGTGRLTSQKAFLVMGSIMGKVSTSPVITPQRIMGTLQAYRDAAALNTAIELELFTRIAHGSDTASRIAAELDVPVRGIRLLCEYLAGSGLLEKEDEQLKLTGDVALYLDKTSPAYLGDRLPLLGSVPLLRGYERLTDAVRAGGERKVGDGDGDGRPEWFDISRGVTDPAAAVKAFAENVTLPAGQPLKILDIGARDGAFGIALARRYPESVVVALDCPAALQTAQDNAHLAGLGTRYQNIPGDALAAPIGNEYDVALIGGGVCQFDDSQITSLMKRIHYSLKKTGQLLILDCLAEDTPEFLREFAGFRLNILAATSRGDVHSLASVKGALQASGFKSVEARHLPAACATLVTARP